MRGAVPEPHTGWTFLTNHARVLAAIAEDPNTRIRDIAAHCRLTERAVQKIIADLEGDGYLSHTRQGRANTYRVEKGVSLRHPAEAEAGVTVAKLLSVLARHDAQRGTNDEAAGPGPAGGPHAALRTRDADGDRAATQPRR